MSKTRRGRFFPGRLSLSLAVLFYIAALGAAFEFVRRVFGIVEGIGLSLLLAVPLVVGLRLFRARPAAGGRNLTLIIALAIIVGAASTAVIRSWYAAGIDRRHAEDIEFDNFVRKVRNDHSFETVDLFVSPKHIFYLRGAVASDNDLSRLRTLAGTCRVIHWKDEVSVRR